MITAAILQVVYQITEEDINAKLAKYTGLTADTPQGYELVRLAIGDLRNARVAIEKRRKELKADSLEYGRKVDAVAKHLTEKIEAIEQPLKAAKATVDDEKARIKAEQEAAAQRVIEEKMRAEREAEEARLKADREALATERAALDAQRAELERAQAAMKPQAETAPTAPLTELSAERFEKLVIYLKKHAERKAWLDSEENNIMDRCGGNFDDAYDRGCQDGETCFARELLSQFKIPFVSL